MAQELWAVLEQLGHEALHHDLKPLAVLRGDAVPQLGFAEVQVVHAV